MSKIKLIVAAGENGIIGNNGGMPWRIPEEMEHFKKTTMGHEVVMGFKTWQSLLVFNKKGYLDGRTNIVLTRDAQKADYLNEEHDGHHVRFYTSFDLLGRKAHLSELGDKFLYYVDIFIIGGAQIYNTCLQDDVVDEIILTKVKMKFNGDTKFPPIDDSKWTLLSVENRQYFDILHYQRNR